MTHTDLIIIGGGPGGYEIAAEAARAGRKVTLIEKDQLGGTCLNRGCIPTKCLLASASAILNARRAAEFGVNIEGVTADYAKAAERMQGVVAQLRQGIEGMLKDVEVIRGEATMGTVPFVGLVGDHAPEPEACSLTAENGERTLLPVVRVDGREFSAEQILIATGSAPAVLPIPGADLAITSDDLLKLTALPKSIAIIGGGVIGMEFASILQAFGVDVTVIEYCKEILPPFDKEVAKRLRATLSRRGVKIIVGAAVSKIEQAEDGGLQLTYAGKKGDETIRCEVSLMAVGRKAVLPEGCAEAGINVNARGFIETDPMMRTSAAGVYAVGDVNGRCMLAHAASAQARVAFGEDVDMEYIPSAVFTSPECAMVGLTEEQCQKEEIAYASAKSMFAGNGKALAMGEGEGFVKVLYSKATRQMLGVHVIGPHASDLVAEATACMTQGATVDDVACAIIHGHPTLSEALMSACANAR